MYLQFMQTLRILTSTETNLFSFKIWYQFLMKVINIPFTKRLSLFVLESCWLNLFIKLINTISYNFLWVHVFRRSVCGDIAKNLYSVIETLSNFGGNLLFTSLRKAVTQN